MFNDYYSCYQNKTNNYSSDIMTAERLRSEWLEDSMNIVPRLSEELLKVKDRRTDRQSYSLSSCQSWKENFWKVTSSRQMMWWGRLVNMWADCSTCLMTLMTFVTSHNQPLSRCHAGVTGRVTLTMSPLCLRSEKSSEKWSLIIMRRLSTMNINI